MSKPNNIQTKSMPLILPNITTTTAWKPYLVFSIFTFVLYANTLHHSFVLDDVVVITENQFTQQGIKGIPDIFKYDTLVGEYQNRDKTKSADQAQEEMKECLAGGRYRPLSLVTFALEVQFFGQRNTNPDGIEFTGNAFVSHLNNILLYLFTGCLLFLILHRLFPPENDKWYLSFPFIVSMLFLAHPIHTEVVANIKGRDEIMTLLGSLAALWFTIKYLDTHKRYNLLLSGFCLFLGLLSKENAITFLAVISLTIYYFTSQPSKRGTATKSLLRDIGIVMIPLVAASAAFLLIRSSVLGISANTSTVISELMNNPFLYATKSETLATIFYTLLIYVKLLFFPHPLTWDYYPYHIEIVNWTNPVAILSLLFYLGITIYAVYGLFKKKDIISYSIWFYLLPLTIVSNLFFPIGVFMGERFVFISSVGFCIFIGRLIYNYFPKITKNKKFSTYLTCIVLIIILCLYSVKTISRNKAWKDNFTLHTTDVKTSKNSAKGNFEAGLAILSVTYEDEAQRKDELCDEALQYLKHAVELYPKYVSAVEALAILYFDCYHDVAKALHHCATILQSRTALISAKFILNQTIELLPQNQIAATPEEIIQSCDELLKVKPDLGEAYYVKGVIYYLYLDNEELALLNFEKADALNFQKPIDFYNYAGIIYGASGNYEKAIQYFLKAIESGSNDYATYINLGTTYQELGDIHNANVYLKKGNEMKEKQ